MDLPPNSLTAQSNTYRSDAHSSDSAAAFPPGKGVFAQPQSSNGFSGIKLPWQGDGSGTQDTADIVASLWRYRWAVLIPIALGLLIGFLVFLKTPETYQSATLLMFESDRPAVVDTMTGDMLGGIPSIDVLRSQLFSDTVLNATYNDERLKPFHEEFENNSIIFESVAFKSLEFETALQESRGASSVVANMTFEHTDPELCEAAIKAFSSSLQRFFADKHNSSRSELMNLIEVATQQMQPKLSELEQRYRDFRTTAPLVWNSDGEAINPHRERQLYLAGRRSELFEDLRSKAIALSAIKSIAKEASDPVVGMSVIGQLIGKTFTIPGYSAGDQIVRDGDEELALIKLDQQLIPLMIQRSKFVAEFGEQHPTVKAVDAELTMMKTELKRLVSEQSGRIVELMEKNRVEQFDPVKRAEEAVNVILIASEAEVELLEQQIGEIDSQITVEKAEAIKLARFEQENAALLREMDRNRELINQLAEQMARVEITEEDGGLRLTELRAPSRAYRVGPILLLILAIGLVSGAAFGCGLALLLEKNANTFRDPDEIVSAIGAPILTHVPFFKGKIRKSKPNSPNPFEELDPYLAVVHNPASVPAEAIRSCRTSLFFELSGIRGGKILQVTSPLPGDGKSTIAGNLACSIAQSGKRTLLIDCDLRRPQVSDNFDASTKLGLIDVLSGNCDHVEAIHDTPLATLKMMPSGPIPANPAEALTLPEMSELLDLLRDEYDYIIVDTPPLLVVTDPSILASMVDGVVVALKIRRKSKPNTKEAAGILRNVGARLLGVVVNNSDEAASSDGYKGYGYYRYGRHTNRYYRKQGSEAAKRRSPVVVSGRNSGLRAGKPIKSVTPVDLTSVNGLDEESNS
ncbi:polysaccharide biosynthesis tyrosine autokinase [Neorhodopirellula lusitana]|uniref:polysaccharide biosynthesis tyrosine autokinase n=1 Tax=Neorhodopirellula lusitana TaxID=445327 RepID=UPI00384EACCA